MRTMLLLACLLLGACDLAPPPKADPDTSATAREAARHQQYVRAQAQQLGGDGAADAQAGAGHQRGLAVQAPAFGVHALRSRAPGRRDSGVA